MKVKNIFKIVPVVVTLMLGSCDNFFNPESGDMLLEKDHFKKAPELKAAFIGVAASFQDVAEHAIIVSEETGGISVAYRGQFYLRLNAEELESLLTKEN